MTENLFVVGDEYEGERIDRYLAMMLTEQSRSYLKSLIKDGLVTVNDAPVKPSTAVEPGDRVCLQIPERIIPEARPEDIPLDILYEDDDLLVVNKPKGMVVHPAPGHYSGTLVNAVLWHCGDRLSGINGVLRPGIVHRIDRDTSGSLIVCKNDLAHRSIAEQLKEHSIKRVYSAVLHGRLPGDRTIDQPIGRDPANRLRMAVRKDGKRAVTHLHPLELFRDYSYVECILETGRTHQIRVHTSWIHHPIIGDEVYGPRKKAPFSTQGQCLHAGYLAFVHPRTGEMIETRAPLPTYFENVLQTLRAQQGGNS